MEGVGQFAAAGHDAENSRAACGGGLKALQDQGAGAFGHHEAVAVLRKRPGGGVRWFVVGRKRREQGKAYLGLRINRAIGCDTEGGIGLATPDCLDAELDRARAGCASRRE